ncbi:YbjN domain-containing protein [Marinomonas sp. IMCC 4694]|nr:YbjN domain-containing protein [Marinomonas sp. IMCC 4694]
MENKSKLILAASLLCLSTIPTVHAETLVSAKDPDSILNIARGFGYAQLETDSQGDPKISGRIDGVRYGIYFYGCNGGANCNDVQFATGWSGENVSLDDINEWNRTQRYGKAYLDGDGDPRLELVVNTAYGVTAKNFGDTLDWWSKVMKKFNQSVLGN